MRNNYQMLSPVDSMFQAMLKLKQANPVLSERLAKLYEYEFECLSWEDSPKIYKKPQQNQVVMIS